MNTKYISFAIVVVLLIGGSFYGGMQYQKGKSGGVGNFGGRGAAGGTGREGQGQGGFARGGGMTAGEVLSKDATSITVKTRDGGSKIVLISPTTVVGHMTAGTIDDVTQGANVTVNGTANADGSVTAQMIQIRPAGQGMPYGRDGLGDATSTSRN